MHCHCIASDVFTRSMPLWLLCPRKSKWSCQVTLLRIFLTSVIRDVPQLHVFVTIRTSSSDFSIKSANGLMNEYLLRSGCRCKVEGHFECAAGSHYITYYRSATLSLNSHNGCFDSSATCSGGDFLPRSAILRPQALSSGTSNTFRSVCSFA